MAQDMERRLVEQGFLGRDIDILTSRCGGSLQTLHDLKNLLDSYDYDFDWRNEYVVRSAMMSLRSEKLTCIDTALLAYILLGVLEDESRMLLAIHRRDPNDFECGHVVAVGKWKEQFYALGKSNYPALDKVFGPYPGPHEIATAFARAYMSMDFTPLYYGLFRPEESCSIRDMTVSTESLNSLCDFMVTNYQYAYNVRRSGS